MSIGAVIKNLRKKHKLSREELAKRLDISYWTLSKYENDERTPPPEVLIKFSNYFNVSTDYLLGRTDDPQRIKENEIKFTTDIIEFLEKTDDLHVGGQKLNEKQRKILIDFMKSVVAPRLQDQDKQED
jgi:transcriptional regulator with XRE-family HTH domain